MSEIHYSEGLAQGLRNKVIVMTGAPQYGIYVCFQELTFPCPRGIARHWSSNGSTISFSRVSRFLRRLG